MEKVRPEYCTDDMLDYLDDLRESGETNMFGAGPYLDRKFPELSEGRKGFHSSEKSRTVLSYWMGSFSERHKTPV